MLEFRTSLILIQPSAEAHYVDLIHRLRDKGKVLCKEVLALRHLPGRVFVVASYDEIRVIRILAAIRSEPYLLPTSDWDHPSLFQPWSIRSITVSSWMKILIPGIYKGDIAYIVGVSTLSDCILAAVVPRLPPSRPALPRGQKISNESKHSTGRKRAPPALFEPHRFQGLPQVNEDDSSTYIANKTVQSFPMGFAKLQQIFDQRFTSRRVDDALETIPLNFPDGECIYLYRKRYYFRGLLILPLYGCGALEPVPIPSTLPMFPFAESKIDSLHIDPVFSQSLWQEGDRLSDSNDIPHTISSINAFERTVAVRLVYDIDGIGITVVPMQDMRRRFRIGDEVIVSAGPNKDRYGFVVIEVDNELTIFADNDQHVRISYHVDEFNMSDQVDRYIHLRHGSHHT